MDIQCSYINKIAQVEAMYKLINIGHSRGVRIPKHVIQQANLEQCGLEFQVISDGLLIKPIREKKRQGWAEAFKNAAPLEHNEIMDLSNQFDDKEWVWEGSTDEKI